MVSKHPAVIFIVMYNDMPLGPLYKQYWRRYYPEIRREKGGE